MIEQLIEVHGFNAGFQMSALVLQSVQDGLAEFNAGRESSKQRPVALQWRDFGPTSEPEGWMFVEV